MALINLVLFGIFFFFVIRNNMNIPSYLPPFVLARHLAKSNSFCVGFFTWVVTFLVMIKNVIRIKNEFDFYFLNLKLKYFNIISVFSLFYLY